MIQSQLVNRLFLKDATLSYPILLALSTVVFQR